MNAEEEKQTWVTPEIVDLDVRETAGKDVTGVTEGGPGYGWS